MYAGLHTEQTFFLTDLNQDLVFSTGVRKFLKYQIAWKYVQWEPSFPCGWTDIQTDWKTERATWLKRNSRHSQFCDKGINVLLFWNRQYTQLPQDCKALRTNNNLIFKDPVRYRAVNAVRISYVSHSVNATYWSKAIYSEIHTNVINALCFKKCGIFYC